LRNALVLLCEKDTKIEEQQEFSRHRADTDR
jgi:hypothetical protein